MSDESVVVIPGIPAGMTRREVSRSIELIGRRKIPLGNHLTYQLPHADKAARIDVVNQHVAQVAFGVHDDPFDVVAATDVVQVGLVTVQDVEIALTDVLGLREVFAHFFEAQELDHPFELELLLVVMQYVEQNDFMTVVSHPLER